MRESITSAHKRILWEHFKSEACPVCHKRKESKWCLCRSCYFALKAAQPRMASGLYAQILNGTDEWWENYARAKEWLEENGHADPSWNAAPKSGELFA